MENLLFIIATTLLAGIRTKRFRTRTIADTGCSVSLLDNRPFHVSETTTGDLMYFAECHDLKCDYGVIVIRFRSGPKPPSEWKSLLVDFTRTLHPSFGIEHLTEPEWNYWHPQSPAAIGFTEYGQNTKGVDWKINSWIDGNTICVIYVKNISEAPVISQELFLGSFRFRH
jgi:hypothetical protein